MTKSKQAQSAEAQARRAAADMERHWTDACPAHRKPRVDGVCPVCLKEGERLRGLWQTPKRRAQHTAMLRRRTHGPVWTLAEEDMLRKHAGKLPAKEIARLVSGVHGQNRTFNSVCCHASSMGIDLLFRDGYVVTGKNGLDHLLGVSANSVRAWIKLGYLKGYAFGSYTMFAPVEVEAFIRNYPWAYDVERMRRGSLRSLADVVRRRDPWLKVTKLAAQLHISRGTIRSYIQRGVLEGRQRPGGGSILIRASDLPKVLAERDRQLRCSQQAFIRFNKNKHSAGGIAA